MEICEKSLLFTNGLNGKRSINKKVIFDLENECLTIEGTDFVYAPNGEIINNIPFIYQIHNIKGFDEIRKPSTLDENGNEVLGDIIRESVIADLKFDEVINSEIGIGLSTMVQNIINNLE